MTNKIIALALGLIFTQFLFAQTPSDTISYAKAFGGYKFNYQGQLLTPNSMLSLMEEDSLAYEMMWEAKASYGLAMVVGAVGGFCIGYPLGTAMGGGEPVWAMAGVGAGLVLLSIPLTKSYNKKALAAVTIFNQGKSGLTSHRGFDLQLGLTSGGVGLRLQF